MEDSLAGPVSRTLVGTVIPDVKSIWLAFRVLRALLIPSGFFFPFAFMVPLILLSMVSLVEGGRPHRTRPDPERVPYRLTEPLAVREPKSPDRARVRRYLYTTHPGPLASAPVHVPLLTDPGEEPKTEIVEIPDGQKIRLQVSLHLGTVRVTRGPPGSIRVISRIVARGPESDRPLQARQRSQLRIRTRARSRGSRVTSVDVEGLYWGLDSFSAARGDLNRSDRPATAEVELIVPSGTLPVVSTSWAGIEVKDYLGDLALFTETGPISIRASEGRFEVRTDTGPIRIVDRCSGSLKIRGRQGTVVISEFAGDVDVVNREGNVTVNYREIGREDQRVLMREGDLDVSFPSDSRLSLDAHVPLEALKTHLPFENRQYGSWRFTGELNFRGQLVRRSVPRGGDVVTSMSLTNRYGSTRVGYPFENSGESNRPGAGLGSNSVDDPDDPDGPLGPGDPVGPGDLVDLSEPVVLPGEVSHPKHPDAGSPRDSGGGFPGLDGLEIDAPDSTGDIPGEAGDGDLDGLGDLDLDI